MVEGATVAADALVVDSFDRVTGSVGVGDLACCVVCLSLIGLGECVPRRTAWRGCRGSRRHRRNNAYSFFLSLISRVFNVEYQWGDETYAGGPSVESLKLLETAYAFVVQETVILDRTIWIYQRHLNKEIIRYFRPSAQM